MTPAGQPLLRSRSSARFGSGAGVNLWIGVAKAGYSVGEEAPVFGIVFAIPAATRLLIWWLAVRG